MEALDFLIGEDGDLAFANGDFAFGRSDQNHIEDLLLANKGTFRFDPLTGVNLTSRINSPFSASDRKQLEKDMRKELELDGYRVDFILVKDDGTFDLDATRLR